MSFTPDHEHAIRQRLAELGYPVIVVRLLAEQTEGVAGSAVSGDVSVAGRAPWLTP
jgi:hypothetical protein